MITWVHQFRPRSAWYTLDEQQRLELRRSWDRARAAALASGARVLSRSTIRGQSDYERLEIWLFPTSLELEAYWDQLTALRYLDWYDTSNLVGVETDE